MNSEIVKILSEIAVFLKIKETPFKPQAYERAAQSIAALSYSVREIYKNEGLEGLEKIPTVGKGIAEKIEEFIKTGKIKDYEKLKNQIPVNISELSLIEGMGPKRIFTLYKKLGIKTVKELEKAAKGGKIRNLKGFGEKTEKHILEQIGFYKKSVGRLYLGKALPLAKEIIRRIKEIQGVREAEYMGSIRRMKETAGDIDILAISSIPDKVMEFFTSMAEVESVYSKGETRSSVRLKIGIDADIRVVPPESFGSALQYFTGSKEHNIEIRKIAIKKGYKLNEYGLFKVSGAKDVRVSGENEKGIYEKLGLEWIPPEMRTNRGEIGLAFKNDLPRLVGYGDLKGDLQTHSDWTDGGYGIEEMAKAAGKYGLEYIAVTDHTKSLAMTGGLDEKKILKQMAEIDKIQKRVPGVKILKGVEVNILKDGTLDISDDVLSKLDIVGVAVHSLFNMSRADMTRRIIGAISNPNVDILFHPTGRIVNKREPYEVDMEAMMAAAKKTKTVMEIDSLERLDLKDEHVKMAIDGGIKLSIDSDAHDVSHFEKLELGIGQARRGWAEKKDVINTRDWKGLLKMLK